MRRRLKVSDPQRAQQLEGQLQDRLLSVGRRAAKAGIPSRAFLSMLAKMGSVQACVHVIKSKKVPDGFVALFVEGLLHLSTEVAVLDGPWKVLFDASVLTCAKERLRA